MDKKLYREKEGRKFLGVCMGIANYFDIDPTLPQKEIAERAIDETYRFFESIGIPMHLREVGIDDSRIGEMAHHIAVNEGLDQAYAPLSEKDIAEIITNSL